MTFDVVCVIALDVISAIQYMETVGVLHKNVKPSNIIISRCQRVRLLLFRIFGIFTSTLLLLLRLLAQSD